MYRHFKLSLKSVSLRTKFKMLSSTVNNTPRIFSFKTSFFKNQYSEYLKTNKQTKNRVKHQGKLFLVHVVTFSTLCTFKNCNMSKNKLLYWFNKRQRFVSLMLFPCSCTLIKSQPIGSHLDSTRCGQSQHMKLCCVSRKKTVNWLQPVQGKYYNAFTALLCCC